MNVVEILYLLFKADTSQVQKESQKAKSETDKLKGSFDHLSKAGDHVSQKFAAIAEELIALAAAYVSTRAVIDLIKSATDYSLELTQISQNLGVNAVQLDAWGNAVRLAGGTVEGFRSSLRNLAEHFGSSQQVALAILPQLASSFSRLNQFQAFRYGKMLGLDESTIAFLRRGRKEVEETVNRMKDLSHITQLNQEAFVKYNIALVETQVAYQGIGNALSNSLVPLFTKFLNFILPGLEYLANHVELIKGALIGLGVVVAALGVGLTILGGFISLVIAGVVAFVAIFALAFEDIEYYLRGQKSLIGDLIKRWSDWRNVIQDVGHAILKVLETIFPPLKLAVELFDKLDDHFNSSGTKKLNLAVTNGKALLGTAGAQYLTNNSRIFGNQASSRNNLISTGPITIVTQATDADGIARDFMQSFNTHLSITNSNFDDGKYI